MRREHETKLSKAELEQITSRRPVTRYVPPPQDAHNTLRNPGPDDEGPVACQGHPDEQEGGDDRGGGG